ncbi:MAG: hypothetical protein R3B96_14090 [Pirellulaceae bacterium]
MARSALLALDIAQPQYAIALGIETRRVAEAPLGLEIPEAVQLPDALVDEGLNVGHLGGDGEVHIARAPHQHRGLTRPLVESFAVNGMARHDRIDRVGRGVRLAAVGFGGSLGFLGWLLGNHPSGETPTRTDDRESRVGKGAPHGQPLAGRLAGEPAKACGLATAESQVLLIQATSRIDPGGNRHMVPSLCHFEFHLAQATTRLTPRSHPYPELAPTITSSVKGNRSRAAPIDVNPLLGISRGSQPRDAI